MLIEKLVNGGFWLLDAVLDLLDVLPQMPAAIVTAIDNFFSLVFGNLSVLNFFFPVQFVAGFALLCLAVVNFERLYACVMWVLRKIPMLGIK